MSPQNLLFGGVGDTERWSPNSPRAQRPSPPPTGPPPRPFLLLLPLAQGLKIIDLQMPDYLRILEAAIQLGSPVLLQNVQEELDPTLAPILNKSVTKVGACHRSRAWGGGGAAPPLALPRPGPNTHTHTCIRQVGAC